jgi:NADPH:quinone reductase-like Zn-dependent oxidoreductase
MSANCSAPEFPCITVQQTGLTPTLSRTSILIKVAGSAIHHDDLEYKNSTLGFDVAGIVVAVGETCKQFKVGDRVWGTSVWDCDPVTGPSKEYGTGGMAEYAAVDCAYASVAPSTIQLAAAGTFPENAQTSLGVFQAAGAPWASNNITVLIASGTGGIGYAAVQLAKALGASEVVTAAGHDDGVAFVKSLGADVVVDYHKGSVYDAVANRSVDLIFDNVGQPAELDKAMTKLKSPGGFFISITSATWNGSSNPPPGVRQMGYNVWAPLERKTLADKLDILSSFIDSGKVRVHVNRTYGFDHIKDAYNQYQQGHILSRIGVVPQYGDELEQTAIIV